MLVRFYVDYRIKPHVPPLVLIPANSVNFEPCDFTHQVDYFTLIVIIRFYSKDY